MPRPAAWSCLSSSVHWHGYTRGWWHRSLAAVHAELRRLGRLDTVKHDLIAAHDVVETKVPNSGVARELSAVRCVRVPAALLACVLALCLVPRAAPARDPDTPPRASDRWLPAEDWVMFHWLPFDERLLYARLGLPRERVLEWLRDDGRHTLAQLAARRGLAPPRLASELV